MEKGYHPLFSRNTLDTLSKAHNLIRDVKVWPLDCSEGAEEGREIKQRWRCDGGGWHITDLSARCRWAFLSFCLRGRKEITALAFSQRQWAETEMVRETVTCGLQTAATYRQKHLLDESMCSVTLLYDSVSEQMGYELVLDRYIGQADFYLAYIYSFWDHQPINIAVWLVSKSGRSTICLMAVSMDNAQFQFSNIF